MGKIDGFVNKLDSQMWHGVEKIALKHHTAARMLAVPMGIKTFVGSILAAPVMFLENVVLTCKSIHAYRIEKDPNMLSLRKKDIKIYSIHAVLTFVGTLCLPLISSINAIVCFVKTAIWPLKTAKINAGDADFSLFKNEKMNPFGFKIRLSNFAFNRFKEQVRSTKNNEEIEKIRFIEDANFKKQIMDEIDLKKQQYGIAKKVYKERASQIRQSNEGFSAKVDNLSRWEDFKKRLVNANVTEVPGMVFNPPIL